MTKSDDVRFVNPLYTLSEAARIVGVPSSTLAAWTKGYGGRSPRVPDVAAVSVEDLGAGHGPGEPFIPFIGLAEALVLAAVRRTGVSMQRIRPALVHLETDIGVEHALASRRFSADGAELLYAQGRRRAGASGGRSAQDLVVVRNGRTVFVDVIADCLALFRYGADGYPDLIRLPVYRHADVVVDPARAFGAPIFERGGARVEDVLERFWSDEPLEEVADEFGIPLDQLEDVVRVASRRAA